MSEMHGSPADRPEERRQILGMASAGAGVAEIAAAIGRSEADVEGEYGADIRAAHAKTTALLKNNLLQRGLKPGREGIAATQAWLRVTRGVPGAPPSPAPPAGGATPLGRTGAPLVNLEEMAEKLRISLPTMRRLLRKYSDFPVAAEGGNGVAWQFDPESVIAFVQAKRDEEAAAEAERDDLLSQISLPIEDMLPEAERGVSAGDRLKLAQAMLKEDEVARQRGFLVLTSDMRMRLTDAWSPLAQFLNTLPGLLGRRHNLPDAVVRDMRRQIETQQRELHRKLKDLLGPGASLPPPEDEEHAPAA